MNFAFYVSGTASRLRKILEKQSSGILSETKLVISDSGQNRDLEEPLRRRGIRFVCTDYKDLATDRSSRSDVLSRLLLQELQGDSIDFCFCFGSHILKGELLEKYEDRIINFHPSLLPLFPGVKAIDQAVAAGSPLLGNTAHFVVDEIDGGPIIMQSVISAHAFHASGYEAILDLQLPMLDQIYHWLRAGRLTVERGRVRIAGVEEYPAAFFPPVEIGRASAQNDRPTR